MNLKKCMEDGYWKNNEWMGKIMNEWKNNEWMNELKKKIINEWKKWRNQINREKNN